MNKIYCTGDLHTQIIERFSFRQNPDLRQLDEKDVMVCLGDVGIGWGLPQTIREWRYKLQWMANQKYTYLLVRGNHDNTDWWLSCPPTEGCKNVRLIDGDLRKAALEDEVFDNIYLIYSSALLEVCGKKCLAIGGAKSHDAQNLAWPHEKKKIKLWRNQHRWHRVIGQTYWLDEDVNIDYLDSLLDDNDLLYTGKVDYIFSHDAPAYLNEVYIRPGEFRMNPTASEFYLEDVREEVKHEHWFHGHYHTFKTYGKTYKPNPEWAIGNGKPAMLEEGINDCTCLFKEIIEVDGYLHNRENGDSYDWLVAS